MSDPDDPVAAANARFRQRYPARVDEIEAAWNAGDRVAAESAAHRLKGAGATFGMAAASEIAAKLEIALAEDRGGDVAVYIAMLRGLWR